MSLEIYVIYVFVRVCGGGAGGVLSFFLSYIDSGPVSTV